MKDKKKHLSTGSFLQRVCSLKGQGSHEEEQSCSDKIVGPRAEGIASLGTWEQMQPSESKAV
jgi:hypothetical protein